MADSAKTAKAAKTEKKAVKFFDGVKAEFKKISWPDKDSLIKQSVAVVVISLVVGAIIAVFDFALQYGVDFITTLKF